MDFDLTILGSASATPMLGRHHTAQVLAVGRKQYLIDCGESTQERLIEQKIRFSRTDCIFISHLHGDHFFGLFGLLGTLHLQGRTEPLRLFGPAGLDEVLTTQLRCSGTPLSFDVQFTCVDTTQHQQVYEDAAVTVNTLPMRHRIPCCGYLFREKPGRRRLVKDLLPTGLVPEQLQALTRGEDLRDDVGHVWLRHLDVTEPPPAPRSYAYCSDTVFTESLADLVRGVDLLYHESTFLHEMLERAVQTGHSTARQAGQLARLAGAKQLLIGHFSSRYRDLEPLLEEARREFADTNLALEGLTVGL
ncbi:ribonuclease Z [Hymenobacter busanensis]|uniref:Ribonuclease Z n=1 Tax=Hymenobacter busanensis TaxID=2607656 RepID=A0A7L5A119_9BACT|nr:ribonuclease Z [Hymenobacter busanensis]KAA9327028.1 ribonuclease Z [Hymenobacter busanensis]QHJ09479.1 ribonuclease Z [Hymenobacter busanensis]